MEIKIQNNNFQGVILCVQCLFLFSKICSRISYYHITYRYNGILLLFKTKMNTSIAKDLNFDISMCDHWSRILSSDQDGQDTPRPPSQPLPPLWPVFQALSGEQIAQKAPLGQKRHSGLGKKRNRSIEHLQIMSSVFFPSIYFRIPFASGSPKDAQKPHTRSRADQKKTCQVIPNYEWEA